MAYYGRTLGIGITEREDIAAIYAVSGRSEGSKSRIARIIDEDLIKRVTIGPIKEPTGEQSKNANLLFYDCMWMITHVSKDVVCGCRPYLVVSNGEHTNKTVNARMKNPCASGLKQVLESFGPEPDSLHTPRIAGEVIFNYSHPYGMFMNPKTQIGIVTAHQELADVVEADLEDDNDGTFRLISTYTGQNDEKPEAPKFDISKEIVKKVSLKGAHAEELAEEFYKMIDPRYVVCTVAAVWFSNGDGWDVAVKNLHEVKTNGIQG